MDERPSRADEDALRARIKAEIRARRRAVRRATPHDARLARSAAICERLTALPEWAAARTILGFVPMRTEVQLQPAIELARERGKRVAAPRMNADFDDLEVREWREGDPLVESGNMFMQPSPDAPAIEGGAIDLVIVPALALDERGHRIGFGKGFYDRLLPRLPRAVRVAVLFDFELVAEVPERDGDERVDLVVTDARLLRTPARTEGGTDA